MKLPKVMALCASAGRRAIPGLLLVVLAGCAGVTAPPRTGGPALPPPPPLMTAGAVHYVIRSELSEVRFLVYRAGPLAAFGHNHVIRAGSVRGDIYLNHNFDLSGFTLTLPVAGLRVDEPADRAVEGADFAAQPAAAAIAGTAKNMLGPALLDAARYPDIRVRSVQLVGPEWGPEVTVRIELRGTQRELSVPVALNACGGQLTVTGTFAFRQTDFGIRPFSILGGGLRVADTVKVRFHIVAQRG
ncbi:MAG: YceI family protein [Gammaproteobacteria bacterium]|nr:YceI family protein [Gammaproteobacteria bacterium]